LGTLPGIERTVAKFLAIDWDETECRYAFATFHNEKIIVRDAGIVPITRYESETPLAALSTAIHSLCKEEKIGSCPLLLSLGRNEVEWLQQKLPPCKESEIPLLLRNQVLREISGSTEFDPIDYLLLESSADGHRVLALTIPSLFRRSLTRTFRSQGHPPLHIGYRAGNAVELVLQHAELIDGDSSEPHLVVNTVGNDADLMIVAEGRITAVRSFRLPAEHQQKSLADEIERTLTIGWEGIDPVQIRHIVLFGDGTDTELSGYLSQSGFTVQFLNPFTLPNITAPERINDPEKFAPLVGSFVIQSRKIKPVIDFLHPKEVPPPPNYARPIMLAMLLLGVVCFGLYQWNQSIISEMQERLDKTKSEHQRLADEIQQLAPSYYTLGQTYTWETQNVLWLDVLKDLSDVLPGNTDIVIVQMTFTTGPVNNNPRLAGSIFLTGMVRDPSVLLKLQNDLQASKRYAMQYQTPRQNPAGGGYPWIFQCTIYRLQ
jgi:hypothetical protein